MSLERQFSRIAGFHDTKEQIATFLALIDELVASGSLANLQTVLSRMLANDFSQQVIICPINLLKVRNCNTKSCIN